MACEACHAEGLDGAFAPLDPSCFGCHVDDYHATASSLVDHAAAGFPTACETCHTTQDWTGADFDHAQTAFPLAGAHANVDCQACHASGYSGTPTDCYSCHRQDYQQTTTPNHATAGFPTACETCHTTRAWSPAAFDNSLTAFPLEGSHRPTFCVWELGAVAHERLAWSRYLLSGRDDEARGDYLRDAFEGVV